VDFARILSNPVRGGVARIEFGLARAARVRVSIFDLAGRQVMRLADQPFEAGVHRMEWNGRDASGSRVRAGAYFLRVQTDDHRFRTVRKMILVD
jgi:flagellar hook assembly protein FlgD